MIHTWKDFVAAVKQEEGIDNPDLALDIWRRKFDWQQTDQRQTLAGTFIERMLHGFAVIERSETVTYLSQDEDFTDAVLTIALRLADGVLASRRSNKEEQKDGRS